MEWSGGFWGGIPAPARIYFWGQKKGETPRERHPPKENNQQLHYQRSFHEGQEFHEKRRNHRYSRHCRPVLRRSGEELFSRGGNRCQQEDGLSEKVQPGELSQVAPRSGEALHHRDGSLCRLPMVGPAVPGSGTHADADSSASRQAVCAQPEERLQRAT